MKDNKKTWNKSQLQNVTSLRTDEHHTWVNIFLTSLTTTAILLIALFTTFPTKGPVIIICLFGFLISFVLLFIQKRALITMKAHEKTIKKIEDKLGLRDSTKNIPSASFCGARCLMTIVGFLQMIVWGIGLIYFLCSCY